jgi:hypothetical protein
MGLLQYGQGLGAFADSFLKSYMSFEENERANKAQEMKAEMMRQEQEDRQRQEAMRQLQMTHLKQQMELAAAAEQRKAADVQRENAARAAMAQTVPNVPSSRGMLTGALPQGQNPWVRPTGEKALNAILPYLDPEKAATALTSISNTEETARTRESIERMRAEQAAALNKMRDDWERMKEEGRNKRDLTPNVSVHVASPGAGGGYGKEERDISKPLFNDMPKLQKAAREATFKIEQYRQLSSMLDKGAGGVEGSLKAALAPVAEWMGVDSSKMSEAQAYQLIARAGAGSMRLNLIGPGQVSEYEQKLIQKLSGGDIKVSRAAAKELFSFYASQARRNITDYNDSVDALAPQYPLVGRLYKKIDIGNQAPSVNNIPAGSTPVTNKKTGEKGYKLNGKIYNMQGQEIR